MPYDLDRALDEAAELLTRADSLLIAAGAGMSVDSGLPDYRGDAGWWTNHAAFKAAGLGYEEVSSARTFFSDPALAWGVAGHKLQLYRATRPHAGYDILLRWADLMRHPSFVFTSNIDGHFQAAGFEEKSVQECHGSVHWLQCAKRCTPTIWSARLVEPDIDPLTLRWRGDVPRCMYCGAPSRPNILMFNDAHWLPGREMEQAERYKSWRESVSSPVVLELGAGTAIPRVRNRSDSFPTRVIRFNPGEWEERQGGVGLKVGALEGLQRLAERLGSADDVTVEAVEEQLLASQQEGTTPTHPGATTMRWLMRLLGL